MTKRITYQNFQITEGDALMTDTLETPLLVRAIFFTNEHKAVVTFGQTDFILSIKTIINRLKNGSLQFGGNAVFSVRQMFEIPLSGEIITILGISPRKAPVPNSLVPQFYYFVQHVDANGILSYTTLRQSIISSYTPMSLPPVPVFQTDIPHDDDPIDVGEIQLVIL